MDRIYRSSVYLISGSLIVIMIMSCCNKQIKAMIHYSEYRLIAPAVLFFLLLLLCMKARSSGGRPRAGKLKPAFVFWFGWFLCFLGIACAGVIHPVSESYYLWIVLALLFIPGILFALAEDEDFFRSFLTMLSKAAVAGASFYALVNFALTPFTERAPLEPLYEYLGIANHPNSNGLLCSGFVVAAVYLLVEEGRYQWLYVLSASISLSMIIAANCRTAELGLLLGLMAGAAYYLRHRKPQLNKRTVQRVCVYLILAAVLCAASCQLLRYLDHVDLTSTAAEKAVAEEPAETEDTEQQPEQTREQQPEQSSVYDRINRLSSDRLTIWEAYISGLKPLGSGKTNGPVTEANPASYSAHNNVLEVLYISGFAAGAGFLIWLLYGWYFIIRSILVHEAYRPQTLFFTMSFLVFFTASMLDVMQYPYLRPSALMTYLSLAEVAFVPRDRDIGYRVVKRLFDILAGLAGCLLLLPVAACVKLIQLRSKDRGPVFFAQTRVGYRGRPFRIYKFRTMIEEAEDVLDDLLQEEVYSRQWAEKQKLEEDPRITEAGRFLRVLAIDEMPQFLNVLRGDMSLVGPRPLVPNELEEHHGSPVYWNVRPGMTGWWICNGHSDKDYGERLAYEYEYVENRSLKMDVICMVRTIRHLLFS